MKKIISMFLGIFFTAIASYAGLIATNEDVPANMDNGTGTALDMAEYLLYNGYSTNYTEDVIVGYNNSYVQLTVSEGSKLVCIDGLYKKFYLGRKPGTFGNKLKIIGEGSTVQFGPLSGDGTYWFQVGFTDSSDNTIEILDGGSLTNAGWLSLNQATNPVIILDNNASFYNYYRAYLGTSYGTEGAKISIKNGSTFRVVNRTLLISDHRTTLTVNGFGSKFESDGQFQYYGINSIVMVEDDGLVRVNSSTCLPTDTSSFYGLAAGFIAVKSIEMDPTVHVKLWDGNDWVQPASLAEAEALGWSKTTYATDAEALAATGYDGLGGYTIYTGGEMMTPIVPKGTCIIIQ